MTLDELAANQEIRDVLMRYCRGVDRLDLDLVRSCYHPDATDLHGSFDGGVDEYLVWVERLLSKYDGTFHTIANVLVEVDGDRAASEAYGVARHWSAGGPAHLNLTTGFRFVDDFERRDGGPWRIARRISTTEWSRHDPEEGWWPVPDHLLQGRRDRTDPVYRLGEWA